ncbi:Bug family tripartite tricarboxylate transporter substrate binding protein [Rubritepida flocculans]|uniref:Bug family tripartite tricarboxylate transporter substrate binding protein n=1 Tax=Rubritepida flocculans TaxID=182403 RepID=UPI00146F6FF1|nr:tripartite tricarboxylate transporter substrate binding protein [Rubritepida flocculans]
MQRRGLVGLGAWLATGAMAAMRGGAAQEHFPSRPIRMVIGFAPGGPTDVVARRLAEQLGSELGQPVVVENRTGGTGSIAAIDVARARPDGYTLLLTTPSAHAIFPQIVEKPGYDPLNDFAAIGLVALAPVAIAAHPSFPARTVPELIALIRDNPGRFSYASGGAGAITHLGMELFLRQAGGLKLVHIPYRGDGPAVQDCVAGHVPLFVGILAPMIEHHRAGRLRILATLTEQRSEVTPDVATAVEHGVPDAVANTYNALLAPAGTPAPLIGRLNAALRRATETAEFRAFLRSISAEPVSGTTPEHTAAYIRSEYARWTPVIRASGLRIE